MFILFLFVSLLTFSPRKHFLIMIPVFFSTIFENISTSDGYIIAGNGQYTNIDLMQRGFDTHLFTGYAFHFKESSLSGIYVFQGIGYLQHQIFIDTRQQNIPQLDENMKKG